MSMHGVELREVECFLALSEELHFGRTAERLGLSRSRVTQLVQTLERRTGGPLVERTSRRVALTPAGEVLAHGWAEAHRALARTFERASAVARPAPARLSVRYSAAVPFAVLGRRVGDFRRRRPDCEVSVASCPVGELFTGLRDGRADAVVTRLPSGGARLLARHEPDLVVGAVLAEDVPVLLVPVGHALADAGRVEPEQLAEHVLWEAPEGLPAWFRQAWTPAATPRGRPVRRVGGAATVEDLLAGTVAGAALHLTGASVLEHLPMPGLVAVPVSGLPPFPIAVVRLREPADPVVGAFADDRSAGLNGRPAGRR